MPLGIHAQLIMAHQANKRFVAKINNILSGSTMFTYFARILRIDNDSLREIF